jgi:hypothetical protein
VAGNTRQIRQTSRTFARMDMGRCACHAGGCRHRPCFYNLISTSSQDNTPEFWSRYPARRSVVLPCSTFRS